MPRPKPWLKMWAEWIHDRKMLSLSLAERGAWWSLVTLAHECCAEGKLVNGGGKPLTAEQIAEALHLKPTEIETLNSMISQMRQEGSIDENGSTLNITNYTERQAPPSDSREAMRERQRKHREQLRKQKEIPSSPIPPVSKETDVYNRGRGRLRHVVTPTPEIERVTENSVTSPRLTKNNVTALNRDSHENPVTQNVMSELIKFYEQYIGLLNPRDSESMKEFAQRYGGELGWIDKAFQAAGNKRRWPYVQAILERYEDEGGPDAGNKSTKQSGRHFGNKYTLPEEGLKQYHERVEADSGGHKTG